MAGTRTPKVDRAVKDFRDLGLALRGVVTQFKMITAPLQGMVQAFQRLSAVYDLSKSTGASMDSLKKYGAVLKSLGGDVKDAASVFGKLDQAVTDMNMGKDSALLNDLAFHFGLTFTGDEKPDEYMDKIRAAMATMSPEMQRALQKTLGMSDAMFHAATLPAKEYAELVAKNNAMRLSTKDEEEATKNSLALRSALGRLSTAWDSLQLQLGNVFAKLIPLIDGLASLIAWIAKSKVAVTVLATVIGLLIGGRLISLIRGVWNLLKLFRGLPRATRAASNALSLFGRSAANAGTRAATTATRTSGFWARMAERIGRAGRSASTKFGNAMRVIGNVIRHPIRSIQRLIQQTQRLLNWFNQLGKVNVGEKLVQGFRAIGRAFSTAFRAVRGWIGSAGQFIARMWNGIGSGFSRMWNGIKGLFKGGGGFIKFFSTVGEKAAGLWKALKGGLAGLLGIFKGLGGVFKAVFGGLLGAVLWAWNGVSFAFSQFRKYIHWDDIKSFFTETIPQMFSSFGDFFSILGGMWSGFWEGLGEGLADVGENLADFFTLGFLPDNWLSSIREFFSDLFGSIMGFIAHPFDSLAPAFEAACGGIKKAWTATRRWLPSWLGGYSDEEKKRLDEEEEKEKAAEKAKEREENAVIAQKQIESFTPQQKVDYDFSQFGATTNGVDLRNISVPTVNLPQMPTLPAPALPDAGKLYDATNLLQLPELPSPDKFQDAFSALETAGSNLRTVNLAAAGASSMVQTTNDNRSAFNTTSTNTSVKVDGITINAQTDSPDKLGQAVMNTLNNYTNYGLDASTSVAGL